MNSFNQVNVPLSADNAIAVMSASGKNARLACAPVTVYIAKVEADAYNFGYGTPGATPYVTRADALSAIISAMSGVDMTQDVSPVISPDPTIFPSGQTWQDVTGALPAGWTGITAKMVRLVANYNQTTGLLIRMWLGANAPAGGPWNQNYASTPYGSALRLNVVVDDLTASPTWANIMPYADGSLAFGGTAYGFWSGILNSSASNYFEAAMHRIDGVGRIYDCRSYGTVNAYSGTPSTIRTKNWTRVISQNIAGQTVFTQDAFSGFSPPDPSLVLRQVGWDAEFQWLTSPCLDA